MNRVQKIQKLVGLSDAEMQKLLYVSRATWWRWSTGKTPWRKIDPLRRDILEACEYAHRSFWNIDVADSVSQRRLLMYVLRGAAERGWAC